MGLLFLLFHSALAKERRRTALLVSGSFGPPTEPSRGSHHRDKTLRRGGAGTIRHGSAVLQQRLRSEV